MELNALAFDHAPVGLCILENRIIQRVNLRFGEMFGIAPEGCANRSIADFYASD